VEKKQRSLATLEYDSPDVENPFRGLHGLVARRKRAMFEHQPPAIVKKEPALEVDTRGLIQIAENDTPTVFSEAGTHGLACNVRDDSLSIESIRRGFAVTF
jgi:hypothetical protein